MKSSHAHQRAQVMTLLLGRYLAGEIAEAQLSSVTDLLDEVDASSTERAAFARFYLDALTSEGEVKMPALDELHDVLNIARA